VFNAFAKVADSGSANSFWATWPVFGSLICCRRGEGAGAGGHVAAAYRSKLTYGGNCL